MMTRMNLTVVLLSVTLLGAGCGLYGIGGPSTSSDETEFAATLTGDAERPDPVETDAVGTGTFSLNAGETQLSYSVSASGLSGDVTGAHFHFSVNGASGSGAIVFAITDSIVNDGSGGASAEGTWPLSAEDVTNLRLDYIYVNFHTDENPAGEVRGNLVPES